jgi:ubiquinone biosynthesis protein
VYRHEVRVTGAPRPATAAAEPESRGANAVLDLTRGALLAWKAAALVLPLLARRLAGRKPAAKLVGARLRRTLQDLGVTYVKLGQFMAMRFDILPEEICSELALLFDRVPPVPADAIRVTLERELGRRVEDIYRTFDWNPIAAASVAQVHRATTADGTDVAVKIQRPGIARIFASDMRNLRRAAVLADRLHALGHQSTYEALHEFERYTSREMDFRTEGRTADRLREHAERYEHVPRVFWAYTTSRVLTMEFVNGHRLSDLIQAASQQPDDRSAPVDLDVAIQHLAHASLRQLFVTGFFHADPHPGNIFLMKDGSVTFIDFGIFGELSRERRETIASYIENVALGNAELAYTHFQRLLNPTSQTDHYRLKREVKEIFRRWYDASADPNTPPIERHLGRYFGEFIGAIRRNKVTMGIDTLLFWRALITLDATALRFRQRFDLLDAMQKFFAEHRPSLWDRIVGMLRDEKAWAAAGALASSGPRSVATLSARCANGDGTLALMDRGASVNRRDDDPDVRLLSTCAAASSLVLVVLLAPVDGFWRVALGCLLAVCIGAIGWTAWRAR